MDLTTVLAGASRLSYADALRIAWQFNPSAWDRAHLRMIDIAGRRGQIDSIQVEAVDGAAGVTMSMALDQVATCGPFADPNEPGVMEVWVRERGPAWSRTLLAVAGAAAALAMKSHLPPDVLFPMLAPLDGTPLG